MEVTAYINCLKSHKNDEKKGDMEAYMKNQFSFLGLQKTERARIEKPFFQKWKNKEIDEIILIIFKLHEQKEREFMYTAQQFLLFSLKKLSYEDLIKVIPLLKINSWWDNTDGYNIAFKRFFKKHPQYIDVFVESYNKNDNLWIARLSIICQLGLKEKTNKKALKKAIINNIHNQDFFIQKAIAWALRDYSGTNPQFVCDFVAKYKNQLSSLAQREALRKIKI